MDLAIFVQNTSYHASIGCTPFYYFLAANVSNPLREVGANYIQCVHRIRLRLITPQYQIGDLPHINSNNFISDPSTRHSAEPAFFDNALPDLLQDKNVTPTDEVTDAPSVFLLHSATDSLTGYSRPTSTPST